MNRKNQCNGTLYACSFLSTYCLVLYVSACLLVTYLASHLHVCQVVDTHQLPLSTAGFLTLALVQGW